MQPSARPVAVPERALLVRLFAYALVVALAMWGYMRAVEAALADSGLDAARDFLAEGRFLETLQVALLALAFLIAVSPVPRPRQVLDLIFALLVGVALVRELDDQLMRALFRHVHRVLMGALLLGVVVLAYARRDGLGTAVGRFVRRPGFYFLMFAALLAGSFAQVLGSTDVWRPLVQDEAASRMAKRFVEEGLESVAYLFVVLGLFEERWFRAQLKSGT